MATWQFDSLAIPRKAILNKFSAIPQKLDMEEFSAVEWWSGINVSKAIIQNIIPFSQKAKKNLIEGVETWGEDEGNRIDIVYSRNDNVREIQIRFDARECSEKFVIDLMGFVNELDCLMITEANYVIDPKSVLDKGPNFFFSLLNQINESKAKRFVNNPEDFLKNLKKEDENFD